jgi:hypothetical protein
MFNEGVMIFLKELVRMGTLEEVLRESGWRKAPLPDSWLRICTHGPLSKKSTAWDAEALEC